MLRSLRTPVVGVGLLLALAACGADSEAVPTQPTSTSTPSPTTSEAAVVATPTSVATVQAEEPTFTPTGTFNEDDAIAFGMFFVQIANHVRVTGDPTLLQRFAEPSCRSCAHIVEATNDIRTHGAHLLHPTLTFEAAYLDYYDTEKSEAEVRVEVSGDLGQVVLADGSIIHEPTPLDHAPAAVQMVFRDGQWRVQEVL